MDIYELIESGISEGERLEYKSTEAHRDKILKELVGLANKEGGRVIIGIEEDDGDIENVEDVASAGDPDGLEESLHNAIRNRVEPVLELSYDTVEYDSNTLIDISVNNATVLHSLRVNGKPTFPIRYGSTTRHLSGFELARAYGHTTDSPTEPFVESDETGGTTGTENEQGERNQRSHGDYTRGQGWNNGVYRSGSVDSLPDPETPTYSAPPNRLIVEAGEHQIATFGQAGIEPFQATHSTVRLEDSLKIAEFDELQQCLEDIDSKLATSSYRAYSYSIKYGSRQLIGRGVENFWTDTNRITEICNRLTPGNGTAGKRARPIGILSFPILNGVGMLELQWDGEKLRPGRTSLQLLLENVPLDTTPYEEMSEEWGWNPRSFEEQTHLQWLQIRGRSELQETRPITFNPSGEFAQQDIVATNPFYDSPGQVDSAFDIDIPWYLCEALADINRLPFDIAGGLHPDDTAFAMDSIEILQFDGLIETFIIDPLCRVASTDADIPDIEMPDDVSNQANKEG